MSRTTRRRPGNKQLIFESLERRQLLSANSMPAMTQAPHESAHATETAARIVNGESTDEFPSVGIVSGYCSGTLISPSHVLTAAHCTVGVLAADAYFEVGNEIYEAAEIHIHPRYDDYDFAAGYDISIIELDQHIDDIAPSPLSRKAPTVGQELTIVGFGQTGTSSQGSNFDFGNKHVGTTDIDGVRRLHIDWDFDTHDESNTAYGDSGGPAFLEVDGEFLVAGVTSGGSYDPFELGGISFDTRVDAMTDWIDAVLDGDAPTDDFVDSPGPDAAAIYLNSWGDGKLAGTLNQAGDRDVFRIKLGVDTTVEIALSDRGWESSFDPFLEFFDGDGTLLASDDDGGYRLGSLVRIDVPAGDYFISAGSYQDAKFGAYNVHVRTTIRDDYLWTEPIDLVEGSSTTVVGVIETVEDVDRFELQLDGPSTVQINVSTDNRLDAEVQVYEASDDAIPLYQAVSEPAGSQLELELEQGTYYIAMSAVNLNSVGSYELVVDSSPRVIDLPDLEFDDHGKSLVEGHFNEGENHEFELHLDSTQFAAVSLQGRSDKLDTVLTVFDESGTLVAVNDDAGGRVASRIELILGPGVYRVVAGMYDDAQAGDYVLATEIHAVGDVDGDGSVGFADYLVMSHNFTGPLASPADKTYRDGDLDGDGDVDFNDFLLIRENWTANRVGDATNPE